MTLTCKPNSFFATAFATSINCVSGPAIVPTRTTLDLSLCEQAVTMNNDKTHKTATHFLNMVFSPGNNLISDPLQTLYHDNQNDNRCNHCANFKSFITIFYGYITQSTAANCTCHRRITYQCNCS